MAAQALRATPPMALPDGFDLAHYRRTLGSFATGVTVLTTRTPDGQRVGVTCNSFNSLSLSPPLVLWSLRQGSSSLAAFMQSTHFAVNILAHDQEPLSRRFASTLADRFDGVACTEGLDGLPLIDGAAAHLQCRTVQRLPGGDHLLFIGQVLQHQHEPKPALLFHQGAYATCLPRAA